MDSLHDTLMDCGLQDLGFSGVLFTWKRGRVRERLNRVVPNGALLVMHPRALVQHLDYIMSDHLPILLDTKAQQYQ
jgi:hypothetical protein